MTRTTVILLIAAGAMVCLLAAGPGLAGSPPPQAPATVSWIPHGYGGNMPTENTFHTREKTIYGFRSAPCHAAAWSEPMWGWDVNGFYRGPQQPEIDPVTCQLPIGLIYPEQGPFPPPPLHMVRGIRK